MRRNEAGWKRPHVYLFVDQRPLGMTHGCLPPGRAYLNKATQTKQGYRNKCYSAVNARIDISLCNNVDNIPIVLALLSFIQKCRYALCSCQQ